LTAATIAVLLAGRLLPSLLALLLVFGLPVRCLAGSLCALFEQSGGKEGESEKLDRGVFKTASVRPLTHSMRGKHKGLRSLRLSSTQLR
jgi:hypothetical protein